MRNSKKKRKKLTPWRKNSHFSSIFVIWWHLLTCGSKKSSAPCFSIWILQILQSRKILKCLLFFYFWKSYFSASTSFAGSTNSQNLQNLRKIKHAKFSTLDVFPHIWAKVTEAPFYFNILVKIMYGINCATFEINKNIHKIIAFLVYSIDYLPKDSRIHCFRLVW